MRKNTRAVRIGGVTVGGGNPVAVQSMLNVPIHDIAGNVAQAKRLEAEGCRSYGSRFRPLRTCPW